MKALKLIPVFFIISLAFTNTSCDPPRNCTEPKCLYSDVSAEISVTLTGNLDSIISIGDTIRLYMKIPETLIPIGGNYDPISFGSLKTNSYFGIISGGFDSLTTTGRIGNHPLEPINLIYDKTPSGSITWNYTTGEYECLFIPTESGRYKFEFASGRMEIVANDGSEWLINPVLKFDSTSSSHVRYHQYISWVEESLQIGALELLSQKKAWYCFEVI